MDLKEHAGVLFIALHLFMCNPNRMIFKLFADYNDVEITLLIIKVEYIVVVVINSIK